MEKAFDEALTNVLKNSGVSGCTVSNKQGLCLGSVGLATPSSSGLLTAIANFAQKLNPKETRPTIILEADDKKCIIQSNDKIVVSVYKDLKI